MISYEKAIEVLRALQRDAYAIDLLKGETSPSFRQAVEIANKEIVDTLLKLDLDGVIEHSSVVQSNSANPEQDMFSYDEGLCPFGREFTTSDLSRLKKTDGLAVGRFLTKEELIQNRLIQALTEYQSPDFERSNIDIVIEYQYGSGFVSSTYRSPSKNNVAVIFVPKKEGKAFLKKGPGWSHFDQFDKKTSLDSRIKAASDRAAEQPSYPKAKKKEFEPEF